MVDPSVADTMRAWVVPTTELSATSAVTVAAIWFCEAEPAAARPSP